MPICYYTRFLFSAPLLLLSLSGDLSGERRGVISLVCLLAHFACLFRLQIVACSEIFLNVLFGEKNRKVRVQNNI